jgi:hypothetical protein
LELADHSETGTHTAMSDGMKNLALLHLSRIATADLYTLYSTGIVRLSVSSITASPS